MNIEQFKGFTPGPWYACCTDTTRPHFIFQEHTEYCICSFPKEENIPNEQVCANGKLMAAAPDLLAEVEKLQKTLSEVKDLLEAIRYYSEERAYDLVDVAVSKIQAVEND